MLALLAATLFQDLQPPTVATLGDCVRAVYADPKFRVEFAPGLEGYPLAYRLERRGEPRADLEDLCAVLYLKCEFDAGKGTVSITRGPRIQVDVKDQKVRTGLETLLRHVRPLLRAEPPAIFAASQSLARQAAAESDRDAASVSHHRNSKLRLLLSSEGNILLRSLVADPGGTAQILAKPYSAANRIPLSPDARAHWQAFLDGRGFYPTDLRNPAEMKDDGWKMNLQLDDERRQETARLFAQQPIPVIQHHRLGAFLTIVTPEESSFRVLLGFGERIAPIHFPPLPAEVVNVPVKLLPLWPDGPRTLSSLSSVAARLNLNYAAWLSDHPIPAFEGYTLARYRNELGYPIEAKRSHGWLSIQNTAEPLVMTSPGWPILLKLLPHYEANRGRPEGMLPHLEALKRPELAALEALGVDQYHFLPERFRPLTAGIRLYRAALRRQASSPRSESGTETIPYASLPVESRDDLRDFFQSAVCLNQYPHFLHPANANRFREASLTLQRTPTATTFGLTLPPTWKPFSRSTPITYSTAKPSPDRE